MSQRFSPLTPVSVGLILAALVGGYTGCKKDEPPPPMPSAAPAPTPTPTEALTLVPETPIVDAGAEDADAGKHVGTGGGGTNLAKCCAALASNAALAPSPNKEYMLAAAQACSIAVGAGQSNAAVLAAVAGALRGAGMPASCK
ncbi:MAG TPA: acyltransferase [Polyangiaceae bacterium]|jgi:hypothetical protein|nr:acyltransferase [Polyangiaceae bacterium]